jgi:hypothetical protein
MHWLIVLCHQVLIQWDWHRVTNDRNKILAIPGLDQTKYCSLFRCDSFVWLGVGLPALRLCRAEQLRDSALPEILQKRNFRSAQLQPGLKFQFIKIRFSTLFQEA